MNATTPAASIATLVGSDPLLAAVLNFNAEADRLENAPGDDQVDDDRFAAVMDDLCDNTPPCTSDEGAFAALALAARQMMDSAHSDLHDALVAVVLDYAHRRQCNA
ncbi:hypothetical protein [Aureimonas phyllosphaerae]|uniref:Uncharacterized protein n=1 Tax=Aureimonas phyllosphaerae TaxID=1166078 RepID=A0A7W6BL70_9HYPH|nr:hypothetical protein [Aureimonas phyllosphaerae]MBB3933891.1 hypothetical protein [Aureimonas phyllosphaerae]MBB3958893.1 hypothetical protein [Aureimonas phyllosphaerae]SFF20744.1 hypothetical protein SAMN05216566_104241 [Aureimonas phyllosphaerae]